jgi:hypothetical protein
MERILEFDVERIFRKLSVLEGTQIRYASKRTMTRFGYEAREYLTMKMVTSFDNPVDYTLLSPRYDNKLIETPNSVAVRLYISPYSDKGNAPAAYLYPADRSSASHKAYITRFARGLAKTNVTSKFPVPYKQGAKVKRNKYGNMDPSQYSSVLQDVQQKGGTVFALPNGNPPSNTSGRSEGRRLPPGIYKREGRTAYLLFALLDRTPTIFTPFDSYNAVRLLANQRLPELLSEELRKALR